MWEPGVREGGCVVLVGEPRARNWGSLCGSLEPRMGLWGCREPGTGGGACLEPGLGGSVCGRLEA